MDLSGLGQVLRKARKNKKLTQAFVAKNLGMSPATLSGIENGTVPEVGIRKVLAYCDYVEVELLAAPRQSRPTLAQLRKER